MPAAITIAILAILLFAFPPLYGQFLPQRLTDYLIFGLPALAVGLIAGQARLLNVGVGATFGVSAYVVAILSHDGLLNPFVLMSAALVSGLLVSGLFAIYAVVASGLEYLLLTLLTTSAFFTASLLALNLTGGENGLNVQSPVGVAFGLDPLQGNGFYWLLCGVTVFWTALSWYLLSARVGRAMIAIGRNPVRAASMGYSVHAYRVWVTLFSGAIAASGGWLYALAHGFVFPDLLGLANSLNAVIYSLIGGVDFVLGPLLGTVGLRFLIEYSGQQTTQSQVFIGLALLVVVYFFPDGVTGRIRQLLQIRRRWRAKDVVEMHESAATLTTAEESDAVFGERGA
ncbi:MAG TPA: branched-chain amino acid ABC transporter permease [Candidatus Dormibacteraeota bacterium]|nr:branched-chain amino acid ABC transporter permease [Candidatus Dormibacteraeota bacterium]